jgi:alanine dehydrogenase
VLVTGAKAPMLVSKELVESMSPGSVIVDTAIDQGGSVETIRPTTHDEPTYMHKGICHYGVTNMPGAVPRTSTYALTNVTLSYACELADYGLEGALRRSPALRKGLNTYAGNITHQAVAQALDLPFREFG